MRHIVRAEWPNLKVLPPDLSFRLFLSGVEEGLKTCLKCGVHGIYRDGLRRETAARLGFRLEIESHRVELPRAAGGLYRQRRHGARHPDSPGGKGQAGVGYHTSAASRPQYHHKTGGPGAIRHPAAALTSNSWKQRRHRHRTHQPPPDHCHSGDQPAIAVHQPALSPTRSSACSGNRTARRS